MTKKQLWVTHPWQQQIILREGPAMLPEQRQSGQVQQQRHQPAGQHTAKEDSHMGKAVGGW
jgi:hypothetical protein